jgi:hypothetical protein
LYSIAPAPFAPFLLFLGLAFSNPWRLPDLDNSAEKSTLSAITAITALPVNEELRDRVH